MSVLLTICVSSFVYLCGNILGHHVSLAMQIILFSLSAAGITISIVFRFITFWFVILGSALIVVGCKLVERIKSRQVSSVV